MKFTTVGFLGVDRADGGCGPPLPSLAPGMIVEFRGKLAVIELCIDPEAITPNTTLSEIREAALNRAGKEKAHVDK